MKKWIHWVILVALFLAGATLINLTLPGGANIIASIGWGFALGWLYLGPLLNGEIGE